LSRSQYPVRMPGSPQDIATQLLGEVGTRLAHTQRVAQQANIISDFLEDVWGDAIVDAAWLHNIGYSPTGGARPRNGRRALRPAPCSTTIWAAETVRWGRFLRGENGFGGALVKTGFPG
jgi:hypothetical protein